MEFLWYWIVVVMVTVYLVLDGFDLGAGAIYLAIAKTGEERRRVFASIGPVWDGNEVWLLAAGIILYFAFPQLYASGFNGFYLLLTTALWLLILRAIGIQFRAHVRNKAWQDFFDIVFSASSIFLAVLFGVMVGNIVRGVPLDATGNFLEPLWTNFQLSAHPGILDWYTVLIGVLSLVTLTAHGSLYVAVKTDEDLGRRARGVALLCWPLQFFLTCSSLIATYFIRPDVLENYKHHMIGLLVPVVAFGSLALMLWANPKGKEKLAFVASSLYIAFMLVGAAFALYPVMLPAREREFSLTIYNTAAGSHGLNVGPVWWTVGIVVATAYFVFRYRMFRGKVQAGEGHY